MSHESVGPRRLAPTRLDHVAINVRDLHRSAAFYARVFNLMPQARSTFRHVLSAPGFLLHLFQAPARRPEAGARDWRRLGVQHVALALGEAEFERAAEVIVAAGSAVEGPTEDPKGRSLYFRDPDGNVIELRSAWDPARVA
ncbi:MAG: VOC family protein [Chloroflexi bacterium]|nr:VOC family protein [Chloroflexota bacterium]